MQHLESQTELPLSEKANPWGTAIAIGFVFAMAVVCGFIARDFGNTAALESFSENTAVGDRKLIDLAVFQAQEGQPRITINGNSVQLIPAPKITVRDSRMRRVDQDPVSSISIYTTDQVNLKGQRLKGAGGDSPIHFVKIGTSQYIQARFGK